MKVLMVGPEVTPYVKVGGLGDVVGALSGELARQGMDVRVVCPMYNFIRHREGWKELDGALVVNLGWGRKEYCRVWEGKLGRSEAKVYFLEHNRYFDREGVYHGSYGEYEDNHERFTFFSRAAIELCYKLGWYPDVMHCHDWTTGLVPVYLNTVEHGREVGKAASVFTIHNLKHQGIFGKEVIDYGGLPGEVYRADCLECLGGVNMMKGGIYNATKLTTVSPNYAREIQGEVFGCGLNSVLSYRSGDLIGVLNGVDVHEWNPREDHYLPENYSKERMEGKARCKEVVQREFGLNVNAGVPLYGVIARMYEQKGLDLLATIVPGLMETMALQLVVIGRGDGMLEGWYRSLEERYRGRVAVYIGYDERRAHLVEAGSDFFIMPSRFEPCGLNQMYSMIYGTPPIVRGTGGLLDTVDPYEEGRGKGSGFIFYDVTCKALYDTIGWACSTYYDRPEEYRKLQWNGMSKDFSWGVSAKRYREVYQWAVETRGRK